MQKSPLLLIAALVLFAIAACSSSSSTSTNDATTPDTTADMDATTCLGSDVLGVDLDDDADLQANSCGGSSTPMTTCSGTTAATKVSFVFKSEPGVGDLTCKLKHTLSAGDTVLDEQRSLEEGYPQGVKIIRVWSASAPGELTLYTYAPPVGSWTPTTQPVPGEGNQLSLFPTYTKEMARCLGQDPVSCFTTFTATDETDMIDGKSCRWFHFTSSATVRVCVPIDCETRSTLMPLKLTSPGASATWTSLKPDTFDDAQVTPQ
ncbi:MAG: hypothetical protein KC609_11000 [Myxococcales bacterium]|nr:hypothetical protein [Myxococcales bacterium]